MEGGKAEVEGLRSPQVDLEVNIICMLICMPKMRRRPKPRCSERSGALFTLSLCLWKKLCRFTVKGAVLRRIARK